MKVSNRQFIGSRISLEVTTSRNLAVTDSEMHLYNTGSININVTIPVNVFLKDSEIEFACDSTGTIPIVCGVGFLVNGSSNTVTCLSGQGGFLKFRSPTSARWFGSSIANIVQNSFLDLGDGSFLDLGDGSFLLVS